MIKLIVKGVTAELKEDGTWLSDNKQLQLTLQFGFNMNLYPPSPSNGIYPCAEQARAAASALNGKLEFDPHKMTRSNGVD